MPHQERENRPDGWSLAYEYGSAEIAKQVYEEVRNIVLIDDAADASVFRFMLGETSFVAIVAQAPLPERERDRAALLMGRKGVSAALPADVVRQLQSRRRAFKSTGLDYFERRS